MLVHDAADSVNPVHNKKIVKVKDDPYSSGSLRLFSLKLTKYIRRKYS